MERLLPTLKNPWKIEYTGMALSIEGSARRKEWSGPHVQEGEQGFRKGFLEFVCWTLQDIKCVGSDIGVCA